MGQHHRRCFGSVAHSTRQLGYVEVHGTLRVCSLRFARGVDGSTALFSGIAPGREQPAIFAALQGPTDERVGPSSGNSGPSRKANVTSKIKVKLIKSDKSTSRNKPLPGLTPSGF